MGRDNFMRRKHKKRDNWDRPRKVKAEKLMREKRRAAKYNRLGY